jgi:hypothetical protein
MPWGGAFGVDAARGLAAPPQQPSRVLQRQSPRPRIVTAPQQNPPDLRLDHLIPTLRV